MKKVEKILRVVLCFLMLLSTVSLNVTNVNATNYSLSNDGNFFIRFKSSNPNANWNTSSGIWTLGSEKVFCLEYDIATEVGNSYVPTDEYTTYSASKKKYVNYIAYFGYGYKGDKSYERYAATQFALWSYVSNYEYSFAAYDGTMPNKSASTGKANHRLNYDEFIKDYNEIRKLAKEHFEMKKPSFHNQTIVLNGIGKENATVIKDNNAVLNDYDLLKDSGLHIEKSGQSLKIWTDSLFDQSRSCQLILGDEKRQDEMGKPLVYSSGKAQKLLRAGFGDADYANFQVIMGTGSLKLAKKDNKGQYVPHVEFKISYNSDMSSPLGTYTTSSDGTVTINDLYTGAIYIQETKVPSHLILDPTIHKVEIETDKTTTFTQMNQWKQGYIQVTKYDKKTNQVVQQAGVEFDILKDDQWIETISTNSNGIAKSGLLDYGTYTIREKKAPQNYVIATLTESQFVEENGKIYEIAIYNEAVVGEIELIKEDREVGHAQGDATLENAQYVLKADEPILNPSDGSVLYAKDEIISIKTIGNSTWGDVGQQNTDKEAHIHWSNLPMGIYRIEEIKASHGYLKDNNHIVHLSSHNSTQKVVLEKVISKEQVMKGKLEVAKSGNDGQSGVVHGLQGVEFTMKLYSEVKSVGWQKAKTYAIIKTDEQGRGKSEDIPFGMYLVKETKTPDNYMAGGDFFVDIDKDQEIEYRMVNNAPFKAWLRLIKEDEKGQKITLSHATFKLKDKDGHFIKQKVGLNEKDQWETNEQGIAVLDNMLVQGEYTICEIKSPQGFLLGDEIKVYISSHHSDMTFDEDNEPMITVKIVNTKPTGKLILHKKFEGKKELIKGTSFKLIANSDVIDPANGKVIYHQGELVHLTGGKDGIYQVNEKGMLEIKGIPLGTGKVTYKLEEVSTLEGYHLLEEPILFDFEMKDMTTQEYVIEKTVENKLTEIEFSKTDILGRELSGAYMRLIDVQGKVIDEWISTEQSHLVKGLIYNQVYTLIEDQAPLGYAIASSITFTYSKDMEKVIMEDKVVEVKKIDKDGQMLKGAKLQVVDTKTKNIVDQWISDETKHRINGLIVGHQYRLEELEAPYGYHTSQSIEFVVDGKENQNIEMIDEQILTDISVMKIDAQSKKPIQSLDFEFGLYVDEACTKLMEVMCANQDIGNVIFENLPYGTYYIKETKAPQGYQLSHEVKKIVIDDQLEGVGKEICILYENERIPKVVVKTEDQTSLFVLSTLMILSSISILLSLRRKKSY